MTSDVRESIPNRPDVHRDEEAANASHSATQPLFGGAVPARRAFAIGAVTREEAMIRGQSVRKRSR